jgi:hypothetical protein
MQGSEHDRFLFVLLGASNLARGYSALKRHISKNISASEFLNALGPGRGYCTRGGLFNFTYSPIGECSVMKFAEIYAERGFRITVLLTDIGNDIMYGVPESSLIESLNILIEKSLQMNAEVFLTSIHVNVSKDMGKTSFKLIKSIFYLNSPVTFDQAESAVKKLNYYLVEKSLQNERVHLVSGLGAFCGLDKIHYGFFKSHLAWSRVVNAMLLELGVKPAGHVELSSMVASLCKNLNRLITSDMLGVIKKPKGFF